MANVLYLPGLSKNLISVKAITENEGKVIFEKEKVTIMKNVKEILVGQKEENGLYVVSLDNNLESFFATKQNNAEIWQRKLGQLNMRSIKKLVKSLHWNEHPGS